ncbi:DMT family transporter [Rhodopseudomonas sp. P2A-2r]|uniref:DMT family transporter n=1 Tax=Rhodopseudomonas sp. P2A-2r TaxID=2991972 RepID=UPI002234B23B|nr:DMT family transporter [Rhodopseudomonas sp. P2A-2r]UZE46673.1 DMT family transporter [Rhodopseudomonas sp. P2A-2r]
MTVSTPSAARTRIAPIGLLFLAITSIAWGLNWPVMKFLLGELPPLTTRGFTGVVGAMLLAGLAVARGDSLRVPRQAWAPLVVLALLNVSGWSALIGVSLLWLSGGEAAVLACTMPVLASLLAWWILGERMSLRRMLAMLMAFAGIVALMGGVGISASLQKLPGVALALLGAFGFALGTVLAKRFKLALPLLSSSAWQIGIGCLPVSLLGMTLETAHFSTLSWGIWALLGYVVAVPLCAAYVCWFAAVKMLPASVAAIGTMAVPVIGVVGSAIALHEPLGIGKIAALLFTLAGVALATRA